MPWGAMWCGAERTSNLTNQPVSDLHPPTAATATVMSTNGDDNGEDIGNDNDNINDNANGNDKGGGGAHQRI